MTVCCGRLASALDVLRLAHISWYGFSFLFCIISDGPKLVHPKLQTD